MRRDHDFVTMEDYANDMRESSEQGAHVVRAMRLERDFWRECFVALLRKQEGSTARLYIEDKLPIITPTLPKGMTVGYYAYDRTHEFRVGAA